MFGGSKNVTFSRRRYAIGSGMCDVTPPAAGSTFSAGILYILCEFWIQTVTEQFIRHLPTETMTVL